MTACETLRIIQDRLRATFPGLTEAAWENAVQADECLSFAIECEDRDAGKTVLGGDSALSRNVVLKNKTAPSVNDHREVDARLDFRAECATRMMKGAR